MEIVEATPRKSRSAWSGAPRPAATCIPSASRSRSHGTSHWETLPMGRAPGPRKGRFPGCGKAGPLRLPGVPEGDPSLVPDGKSERGSAPALQKDARDQREKCVFVLTKGMSLVGHWPTRLDHIGFAPLRSVWGFARPCLPETGKTNRHKSVQRLRGFLRPRELRVPNQAPALKGMAPSAMVCRARSLTAEE